MKKGAIKCEKSKTPFGGEQAPGIGAYIYIQGEEPWI